MSIYSGIVRIVSLLAFSTLAAATTPADCKKKRQYMVRDARNSVAAVGYALVLIGIRDL